jgi:hypothetical protein
LELPKLPVADDIRPARRVETLDGFKQSLDRGGGEACRATGGRQLIEG